MFIVSAKPKFEILELHDIEKEFMLVDARLRLISRDPDTALAAGNYSLLPYFVIHNIRLNYSI